MKDFGEIDLDGIIAESVRVLMEKGYTDMGMRTREPEGMFREHIRMALDELLNNGQVLLNNEKVDVHTVGYFEKDKVLFSFRFDYDVFETTFHLERIEARLQGGLSLPVTIQRREDIWFPEQLYERLKQLNHPIEPALQQQTIESISQAIREETQHLKELGFEAFGNRKPGWLEMELEKRVALTENKKGSDHYFTVSGKLIHPRNKQEGTVNIKLHFYYNSDTHFLNLKSIHANMGTTKELFIYPARPPDGKPRLVRENELYRPTAEQIWKQIADKNRVAKATTIMNTEPAPSSLKINQ